MKQQKEMPGGTISPSPRFRYWFTPPESIRLKASDIEPFVPKANWKAAVPPDLTFEVPAEKIFSKNVPRISLKLLAELLPDHISSSDGLVKLPAMRLAAAYHLVENKEELPPEKLPEPEPPEEPEIPAPSAPVEEPAAKAPEPGESKTSEIPVLPPTIPPLPKFVATNDPAPISELPPEAPNRILTEIPPPPAAAVPEAISVASPKFPPRRTGSFVGLPIFRRKTAVPPPPPPADAASVPTEGVAAPPAAPEPPSVPEPPVSLPEEPVPVAVVPEIPLPPPPAPAPPPVETVDAVVEEPVSQPLPPPPAIPEEPPVTPVRMLHTEHVSMHRQEQGQEIVEQEPLQALFLTEENLSVNRVIELCGGLPGINSCVLAHGSVVVASHNVPDGVDLVSMSAHASDMLQAMRASSARMGVGTVPAVTLHTEKGVISFFNRDDLTMLVFHKDRGFVPGVREKMAAVLGELTKARLTLPVGNDEP